MKKLLLTSSFVDVSHLLENFIDEKLINKQIAFIPTASIPEHYKDYVENDRKAFEKLGLTIKELEVSTSSKKLIEKTLKDSDFIYVSGGNTFYLLQELKKSGADKVIIEEVIKGKPYIGASAGSVIMAQNITYTEKMDDKNKADSLNNYNALNLIDFYPVPHHTNNPFKEVVDEILNDYRDKLNLIPISNTEAIEVNGHDIKIVGKK
ncbi:Type 1 glutamine amidotransferase-like domain-containing protein [Francisella frigiditurris]|uniref:Peptidase S51 family protein n=1 Tax=Francisella frigiditurris TaxID=1542390 RepID=A0A1J0KSI0_9GAMM|nr:Type 1 glutamine amidotransferase-like domain-containing protein [Francisella frigiditurris]APC96598.1 hypothetical protein KX01_1172 [Francisella frigiditurris]